MEDLEIKEAEIEGLTLAKTAEIVVEEDKSMNPLIVTEDDRLTKNEIEVTAWESPSSFLTYLKKALGTVPTYADKSPNSLKRAIAYYDNLLAEIEEAMEKDAEYVDFDQAQVKELDLVDSTIIEARNKVLEKLSLTKEGNVKRQQLVKKATTPANLMYTVDPFLKAIAMICINAKIQGGKNIEEVYQQLKKEYGLDKREDLAILQVLKDSGYPVRHSLILDSSDMIDQYYA